MKLYIPEIGDILELEKDWTFKLFMESRNYDLYKDRVKENFVSFRERNNYLETTFVAGTKLKIARIYIRNGAKDYSSITFSIQSSPGQYKKGRFWAKLQQVNNMHINIMHEAAQEADIKWGHIQYSDSATSFPSNSDDPNYHRGKVAGLIYTKTVIKNNRNVHIRGKSDKDIETFINKVDKEVRDQFIEHGQVGDGKDHDFTIICSFGFKKIVRTEKHRNILGIIHDIDRPYLLVDCLKYTLYYNGAPVGSWGTRATARKKAREIANSSR